MRPAHLAAFGLSLAFVGCTRDELTPAGPGYGPSLNVVDVPCTGTALERGEALRTAVEATTTGTVQLGSCLYEVAALFRDGYNTGIRIGNKNALTIQGTGMGNTVVKFQRPVYIGFEIQSNTSNLAIRDMTVAGSVLVPLCQENGFDDGVQCYTAADGSRPPTHGIGSQVAPMINGVLLTNLEIKDLAIGIQVGSLSCDPYIDAVVSNNYIHDIRGKYSGSGYGIVSHGCGQNITIRKNVIARTQRHAIYQGHTAATNAYPVVITENTIVDHGHGGELYSVEAAALVVARSDNVTVIDNELVGGHTYGLSAEYDAGLDCTRCLLIGNKFVNRGTYYDIWISAHSPVWTWFNTRDHNSPPSIRDDYGQQWDVAGPGDFWAGTQAVAGMYHAEEDQNYLYVMQNGVLHRVYPDYGNNPETGWRDYRYSTTSWFNFFGLTADDGKVYVWQNDHLHSVTPQWSNSQWPYTYSGGWFNPGAMASRGDGFLYVIQNSLLHRVNPSDWSYSYSTTGWSGPLGLAVGRDAVYVRSGTSVYQVTPGANGTPWPWTVLDW